MSDEEKKEEKKHPADMTSDELLDYALAPELAARLREIARGDEPGEPDLEASEGVDC